MHPCLRISGCSQKSCPRSYWFTPEPALLAAIEPVLCCDGRTHRDRRCSSTTALTAMTAAPLPKLAFLDGELPASRDRPVDRGRPRIDWHPSLSYRPACRTAFPKNGVDAWPKVSLDDLIPRAPTNPHWRLRLDFVLRTCDRLRELDQLRVAAQGNAQTDPLTGVYNRSALLSACFAKPIACSG